MAKMRGRYLTWIEDAWQSGRLRQMEKREWLAEVEEALEGDEVDIMSESEEREC